MTRFHFIALIALVAATLTGCNGKAGTFVPAGSSHVASSNNMIVATGSNAPMYGVNAHHHQYSAGAMGWADADKAMVAFASARHDDTVSAVNLDTGKTLWSFGMKYPLGHGIAVAGGAVYFGCYDHFVYALDAKTGALLWKFETGWLIYSSPAVVDGMLYIGSNDNYFYALDAKTGTLRWKIYCDGAMYNTPCVVDGTVYAGSLYGRMYALDAKTGKLKWKRSTGDWIRCAANYQNGRIYFGTASGKFYCMDAQNGDVLWLKFTGGMINMTCPLLTDHEVICHGGDGLLYCYDAMTGNVLWTKNGRGDGLYYEGKLYLDGRGLECLDPRSGKLLWTSDAGGRCIGLANGKLYVSGRGTVRTLDPATGNILETHPLADANLSPGAPLAD